MKRIIVTITLAAAAAWILAIPAAGQGRSQSHPGGGSAAAGSMSGGHGMDASGNSGSGTSGPRAPGQLLTQNTQLSSKLSGLLPAGTDLQTAAAGFRRSEEHTSELQSPDHLVCRLLLEKKKTIPQPETHTLTS